MMKLLLPLLMMLLHLLQMVEMQLNFLFLVSGIDGGLGGNAVVQRHTWGRDEREWSKKQGREHINENGQVLTQ